MARNDEAAPLHDAVRRSRGWLTAGLALIAVCVLAEPAAAQDECALYGYSGNVANTLSCVDGVNSRTITCQPGFAVPGAGASSSVTLFGNAVFAGCVDLSECGTYGCSGQPANTQSCIDSGVNQRTISRPLSGSSGRARFSIRRKKRSPSRPSVTSTRRWSCGPAPGPGSVSEVLYLSRPRVPSNA